VKPEAVGYLRLRPFLDNSPKDPVISGATISFDQEKDRLFFASPVSVLFRDLTLPAGDVRTCESTPLFLSFPCPESAAVDQWRCCS